MTTDMSRKRPGKWKEKAFGYLCLFAVFLPLVALVVLLISVTYDGLSRVSYSFLTGFPSRDPEIAGIYPALVGSIWVVLTTALVALPIGVGAAVYLEEYGRRNRLAHVIEVNIANLAGVPSIIYGLLGLEVFVRVLGMGRSVIAGALTLALLVLPVVILATREAIATVPNALREGALALGATKWETTRRVVLPLAFPGILTGTILSIARALGETAPLITIGALTYVPFLPDGLGSPFTVLPIQIFNWVSRPQKGFILNAAAGIIVLMVILLAMNVIAIYLRNRFQKRIY